jgi:hypothetical protein
MTQLAENSSPTVFSFAYTPSQRPEFQQAIGGASASHENCAQNVGKTLSAPGDDELSPVKSAAKEVQKTDKAEDRPVVYKCHSAGEFQGQGKNKNESTFNKEAKVVPQSMTIEDKFDEAIETPRRVEK